MYQHDLYTTTRLSLAKEWQLILGSRYSSFTYDYYFTNLTTGAMTRHSNYKVRGKTVPYGGLL
ncbi:hypothetical protein M5G07_11050 [Serratia symbiotica]|nr:hypothetical protein [Serratia symbiotica]